MKQRADSQGFTILEALLMLAVLSLLGVASWYVWQVKYARETPQSASNSTQQASKQQASNEPVFNALPSSFSEYKNSDYGLRLGYPTEAGTMSVTSTPETIFAVSTPETYNPQHNWDGSFSVGIFAKSGFTFGTAKYGATIKPENGQWVVVAVNPADSHKVGDIYAMPEKRINGGVAYEFTDNDEGYPSTRWLIELANGYAVVGLPRLITHDITTNDITAAQRAAYTQLTGDVLASFTKF